MLHDIKTNAALLVGHVPASRNGAALVGSTVVNMGQYSGGSFLVNVGTVSSGGTLAGKLQYSSTSDFSSDVVDDDGSTGNTAPATGLGVTDTATRFHIKQPKDETRPYYRLALTDGTAAVIYSSVFVGVAKTTPVVYS